MKPRELPSSSSLHQSRSTPYCCLVWSGLGQGVYPWSWSWSRPRIVLRTLYTLLRTFPYVLPRRHPQTDRPSITTGYSYRFCGSSSKLGGGHGPFFLFSRSFGCQVRSIVITCILTDWLELLSFSFFPSHPCRNIGTRSPIPSHPVLVLVLPFLLNCSFFLTLHISHIHCTVPSPLQISHF